MKTIRLKGATLPGSHRADQGILVNHEHTFQHISSVADIRRVVIPISLLLVYIVCAPVLMCLLLLLV